MDYRSLKIVRVVQAGLEHLRLWPGSPAHLVWLPNRAAALPQQHSRAAVLVVLAGALALALLQHPRQQLAQATATCGKCASDCPPQQQLDEKGHLFFCAEHKVVG